MQNQDKEDYSTRSVDYSDTESWCMTRDDLRKQAWDFFQMQAGQRLMTFNFYIVISSVLCTGLAASFKSDFSNSYIGASFGFLLILFSFIFSKLDRRNRDLIKGAEETLKFFEGTSKFQDVNQTPHIAKRFLREEFETTKQKSNRSWRLWQNCYSYSECFKSVFVIFSIVGLAGSILSICQLISIGK